MRHDAYRKRKEARQKYNLPPKVANRSVLVEYGGTTQVYVGAVGKPSRTGPRPGTSDDLVHILPGQGALDGGLLVKAVKWPVIAIPKKTSFTSEEEATSALKGLRLAEVKGKGEVNVEETDVTEESGAHMVEQFEKNVVVDDATLVEDTACVKKETTDEVMEEGAEEAPSVDFGEGMKVEAMKEAKPDEEPKEGVGMRCESGNNTASVDNTTSGDNTTNGEETTSGDGDSKQMPSRDFASLSSAAVLVPTRGTPHLWDPN